MKIGLLHPGAMGAALGACFRSCGHEVYWLNSERSAASQDRARRAQLLASTHLDHLLSQAELIVSICPPHAADTVLDTIATSGYEGHYLEANAIAPKRLLLMRDRLAGSPIQLTDGSVIGLPLWPDETKGGTTLHLSGPHAATLETLLAGSPLTVKRVSDQLGDASALKMTFAAFSKGSAALTAEILNVASQYGVSNALAEQLGASTTQNWQQSLRATSAKAWRFSGEMKEIAETFRAVGAEPGFHEAASKVYQKLEKFKDWTEVPELSVLIAALKNHQD